jgi:prepilin-type N-terminal cleavage/methylation domain-containing protein
MKKTKRGFTLIELLVVISIISLLSSVVMASVNGARTKAKENAFRSEIMQFVNALEMYKNDKKVYPLTNTSDGNPYFYGSYNDDVTPSENTIGGVAFLSSEMSPYIKSFPKARGPSHTPGWFYMVNNSSTNKVRCTGSVSIPEYVIVMYPTYWGSNFKDWPTYETSPDNFTSIILPWAGSRCFSLK